MDWTGYGASHTGRRDENQDSFSVSPDMGLFVVADGMGGYLGGGIASRIVVSTLERFFDPVRHHEEDFWASGEDASIAEQRLDLAIRQAHQEVITSARGPLSEMGSTVVAMVVHGKQAVIAHVGDSRLYRLRAGKVEQLTYDHSVMAELVAAGRARADIPSRYNHVITRSIAPTSTGLPDMQLVDVEEDDVFLLCSDGLTDVLDEEEIARVLSHHSTDFAARTLIVEAYNAGSSDNITAVVARAH